MKTNEEKLWGAVLDRAYEDAIGKFKYYLPKKKSDWPYFHSIRNLIIDDARSWFNSKRNDITSFLWLCVVLDLDSDKIKGYINSTKPIQSIERRNKKRV